MSVSLNPPQLLSRLYPPQRDAYLEGIKLEYGFVSEHLRDLVKARFLYIGAYIAASAGYLFLKEPNLIGSIAFIFITLFAWRLDLRTRLEIRTCSGRLTSMERDVFGYETGFFVLNHEFHPKFGMHSPNKGTETGIKEEIFLPRFLAIIIGKSASAISYLLGHGFIRASDQMKDWHEIEPASKYSTYFVARALPNTRLSDYQPMFDILFVTMFFVYAGIAGYILVDKL